MKRFCSRIKEIKDHRSEASVWWAWPDGCLIMVGVGVSQMAVSQNSVECAGAVAVGGAE